MFCIPFQAVIFTLHNRLPCTSSGIFKQDFF
jgi:hypothetical protein